MSNFSCYGHAGGKRTIQQLPIPARAGHNAIIRSKYLEDIVTALGEWECSKVALVYSKALDENTEIVKELVEKLGSFVVGSKRGVGTHSPYEDILDITKMLVTTEADCLISIGSSSYSDACKIARLMQTNLDADHLTANAMEELIDQDKGRSEALKDPTIKLILVPTSLSASEWNNNSSATNPDSHKKQHFASPHAAPDLILLDPEVAATSPRKLWLSSGMRAVDHCVETMLYEKCTGDVFNQMDDALCILLKGLKNYKDGESEDDRSALLDGISDCQIGSRNAMMGLLLNDIPMGPSHAIGHQLGSTCGVMHGVTSCVVLAPTLRHIYSKSEKQRETQPKVLEIWNKVLRWEDGSLAEAVAHFTKYLNLPSTLKEVGVEEQEDFDRVADRSLTDVFGAMDGLVGGKEDVIAILDMARG